MVSIRDCTIDAALRAAIPISSSDGRSELAASVRKFGYLAPVIAWRNERGELVLLDGHGRCELWRVAIALPDGSGGLAAREPAVVVLDLPSRDDAMLFVLNAQLGRRNLSDLDRIKLVSQREEIIRRMAKARQLASLPVKGEWGFQCVKSRFAQCVDKITNTLAPKAPVHTRKELSAMVGVSESTYDAGKLVLQAAEAGTVAQEVLEEIRTGKATIHGVASGLKGNTKRKTKTGWATAIAAFVRTIRRFIKRDPNRRAEIAAELRRLADEIDLDAKAAA